MRLLYTVLSIIGFVTIVLWVPGYVNRLNIAPNTAGLFPVTQVRSPQAETGAETKNSEPEISSSTQQAKETTKNKQIQTVPAIKSPKISSPIPPVPTPTPAITPVATQAPPRSQSTTADMEKINQEVRPAVVNILCTVKGSNLPSITGSGVIIDPRGVILTSAHIGQFFLLRNFRQKDSVVCQIRTGSPAYPAYNAELMYISPRWVEENKNLLKGGELKGTGERDFALLHITGKLDGTPLPDSFPYLVPSGRENFESDEPVVLVSYPAGFLGNILVVKDLNLSSAVANIQKIYTFGEDTPDLLSVPGSILSQKGASGGAVVDQNKNLLGIITTSTDATTTADRDLRAITVSHISSTIAEETSASGLFDLLSHDPAEVSHTFQISAGDALSAFLIEELSK